MTDTAAIAVELTSPQIKLLVATLHDIADLRREEPDRLTGLDCDYDAVGALADRLHLLVTDDQAYIAEHHAGMN